MDEIKNRYTAPVLALVLFVAGAARGAAAGSPGVGTVSSIEAFIRVLGSLGVGGVMSGAFLWIWYVQRKDHKEELKSQRKESREREDKLYEVIEALRADRKEDRVAHRAEADILAGIAGNKLNDIRLGVERIHDRLGMAPSPGAKQPLKQTPPSEATNEGTGN